MGTTDAVLAPPRAHGVLLLLLGTALAVAAAVADAPGPVLLLPAAVVALGLGARDLLLRPVLAADALGLSVVDGTTRRRVGWESVERLRVVTDRRTPVLELDLGEDGLVVLTRRRLGTSPAEALALLEQIRP